MGLIRFNFFGDNTVNTFFSELDPRGLSGSLWKGFNPPEGGIFGLTPSGNPAFGIFDDFLMKASTTLYDGYFTLGTGTGSVTRIASDYNPSTAATLATTGLGIVQLLATADNDEAVMAFGNALDAPFHLGRGRDLAFECRLNSENVAADDFCLFVGLAELGAQATVKINDANQDLVNEFDLLGFQHLMTDSTAINGLYQVGGQTAGTSVTNTGLAALHTLVADTYVKLGFRYNASTGTLHFFVNGVEDTGARLRIRNLTAGTFPDDNFMTPMIMLGTDQANDSIVNLDWWACAQML